MLKILKLFKLSTFFYLLHMMGGSHYALAETCEPKPLTKERIEKVQNIVADTLEINGDTLYSPICFEATFTTGIILKVLGYEPIRDYQLLASQLHAFVYFPKNNLISDTVMAQWSPLMNTNIDWVAKRGFIGTPKELSGLLINPNDLEDRWLFSPKDYNLVSPSQENSKDFISPTMDEIVQQFYNSFFKFYEDSMKNNFYDPSFDHIRNIVKPILKDKFGCKEENWLSAAKKHIPLKSHRIDKNLVLSFQQLENTAKNNSVEPLTFINSNNKQNKEDEDTDLPFQENQTTSSIIAN